MTVGYNELTMNRLLKETGLSKGGFYHHFKSKEELFEQAIDMFFFDHASDASFQPSVESTFIENMHNFLSQKEQAFLMFASQLGIEHSEINFFMFIMQAIQHLPGARQKTGLFMYKEKQQIEKIIDIAIHRKEIRQGIEKSQLAAHLVYMFDGVEMHGVLLSQSFETLSREKEMVRQLYEWIKA